MDVGLRWEKMADIDWYNVVPSGLSAFATIAAALAAWGSYNVSKQTKLLAEQSSLAVHHSGAVFALSQAVKELLKSTESFFEVAYGTYVDWPREIERLDHQVAGGSDPRPLRHVFTNASEMLVNHGMRQEKRLKYVKGAMYSIVRDGVDDLTDDEYDKLLRRADGKYPNFEKTLGEPVAGKRITEAPAFRWACYQLSRRIDGQAWQEIWEEAWLANGWITKFRSEHNKVRPTLESIQKSLNSEKAKLAHSVFPLESNPSLYLKYQNVLDVTETLLDDCSLESMEAFRAHFHKNDVVQWVIYSMGIAVLVQEALNKVHQVEM